MILSVDSQRALPIYEQIREQVRRMVAVGTLSAGTQLPTIRQLAADLGLAKGTVAKAYELLEIEGLIASNGRKGSVVIGLADVAPNVRKRDLATAADSLVVMAHQLGASREETLAALTRAWERV